MRSFRHAWVALAALLALSAPAAAQQQAADPDYHPVIARPAFTTSHPRVLIDEAHRNFHTADGRYAPFADLLRADGFDVVPNRQPITATSLKGTRVLVIANAGAPASPEEAQALRRWVEGGGALLLIADHAPFGAAAERLGQAFGVEMGKGYVFQPVPAREPGTVAYSTQIEFSRENGRLGDHPITRGRNAAERVGVIRSFTGQSLSAPSGATSLMVLSQGATEAAGPNQDPTQAPQARASQGLAMMVGKGRVVVLGEAAMLSAQVVDFGDGRPLFRMGMNVAGYDNQQFALNLMRWLAGAF